MSIFGMKFNSAEMAQTLSAMLQPDEVLEAAVYAVFMRGVFESGPQSMVGYLGLTNQHRLIGCKYALFGETQFSVYLQCVTKLKVKKTLFGQRRITLKSDNQNLNIQIVPKIYGKKFPDQGSFLEKMLSVLNLYQR